ncbi:hypothetical protein DdX_12052 [Ditylenchus destructor]|uniref:Uncharacterized protein n=1 Tax=Ditylenchus destructor TaxID=166010 RepID=A0AAD4N1G2_9BILA|nr:hypothetical protein DdX_12052 [Ditylenchus destructor]
MQNFAPPCYEEENRQTLEVKPKRCAKLRKWLSNHRKTGLFASALGIVMCTVLVVIHIVMLHIGQPILYFLSGMFFISAFLGLKQTWSPFIIIFLIGEIIELFVFAIYCVFLLTVFIILPDAWKPIFQRPVYDERYGCYICWFPSGNVYCNSDEDLRYVIFYTLFGSLIYLTFSALFYWLIWRAYKTDNKTRTPVIPRVIPAYSPPYNIPNCPVVPTPDLISNVSQPSHGQQNQPTFFNHQKLLNTK